VPGAEPPSQLIEHRQGIRASLFNHGRLAAPVGTLKEVHEIDAYRLFGLADLPVLASTAALELFTELASMVCQGFVRGGAREKPPDPADAGRGSPFLDHPRPEEELAEPLKRRLQFPHDLSTDAETSKWRTSRASPDAATFIRLETDLVGVPPAFAPAAGNAELPPL
jgi:hypothetical protein